MRPGPEIATGGACAEHRQTALAPHRYPSRMDPQPPTPDDSAAAEERAADDGWAAEGESSAAGAAPSADTELEPEAPTPSPATESWRGPETSGFAPDSLKPTPSVPDETAGWRGPETSGWTPEKATSAPVAEAGTEGWRGPEPSGWAPGDRRLVAPEPQAVAPEPQAAAPEPRLVAPEPAVAPEPQAAAPEPQPTDRAGDLREVTREAPPLDDIVGPSDPAAAEVEPARRPRVPAGLSFFSRTRPEEDDIDDDAGPDSADAGSSHLRVEERPRRLPGRRASEPIVRADPAEICPFLVAASGGWRLAVPSREHRCGAVNPASPLSPQKQTRLCLTEGHLRCATFLAAGAARESRVGSAAMPDRVSRWALARTTPVVEEVGGVRTTLAGMLADRRRWPAIPAMLLVVALATLGLSSLRGGGPVTALASPTPEPTEVALATPSVEPTPTVAPTPEPSPSVAPTEAPTAAPTPAPSHATYTVLSGDTLGAIARQFGTTVQALVDLNGITDPGRLKIGQVLLIP